MRLRLVPSNTSINFLGNSKLAVWISGVAILTSFIFYLINGLNYGIDFRGGTMLMIKVSNSSSITEIRKSLNVLELGDTVVTKISDPADSIIGTSNQMFLVKIEQQDGDEEVQNNMIIAVKKNLSETVNGISFLQTESVGSKISGELVKKAILAVCLAVFAVLFYIWIRFEWQFSMGAVLALIHDVVVTIGIFSIIGLEFNLSIIAALLTIVGYSLNDTVIVFDRIRENLKKYQSIELIEVLNKSINETLSRTIITSLTTLLALLALFIFGGEVIRGFTFAMIWGVLIGTYSSIFIASSLLLKLGVKRDWSNKGSGNPGTNFDDFDS
ncbi:MAG: protein translocase subunit SecF [Paracoccaceae bacterium]